MIEIFSTAISAALVGNHFSPFASKTFISHQKKICCEWFVTARNLQIIKTFLTLALSRFSNSGSNFPQRLLPNLQHPVFVHARPTRPSFAGARPQGLGHWFCSQNLRLSSGIDFEGELTDDRQGLELGLKPELCRMANELSRFYLLRNPWINWIRFRSVENAEIILKLILK